MCDDTDVKVLGTEGLNRKQKHMRKEAIVLRVRKRQIRAVLILYIPHSSAYDSNKFDWRTKSRTLLPRVLPFEGTDCVSVLYSSTS